jgi:hypothetical protein
MANGRRFKECRARLGCLHRHGSQKLLLPKLPVVTRFRLSRVAGTKCRIAASTSLAAVSCFAISFLSLSRWSGFHLMPPIPAGDCLDLKCPHRVGREEFFENRTTL